MSCVVAGDSSTRRLSLCCLSLFLTLTDRVDVPVDLVRCFLLHTCAEPDVDTWFPWKVETVDSAISHLCRVRIQTKFPGYHASDLGLQPLQRVGVNIFDGICMEALQRALQTW